MQKEVLVISGFSCSGKSTLIQKLERVFNCDVIKFGAIHRKCVKNNGYEYAKDWIAKKGIEDYDKELLYTFMQEFEPFINKDDNKLIIIDGIFSYKCFQLIRFVHGINSTNIVLKVGCDERICRMAKRQNMDYEEAANHLYNTDFIKYKVGLQKIIEDFDFIIDGSKQKDEVMKKCLAIIPKEYRIDKDNEFQI